MAITTINENDLIKDSRSVINNNFAELDAKLVAITNAEIEELWAYTVTITQSANQTITVTAGGVAHTSTFTAQPGTTWTATIVADEGYNAGTLSATSGTLTDNITISATSAYERGSLPGSAQIAYAMQAGEYNVLGFPDLDDEQAVLYSLTGYYNDSAFGFYEVETVTGGTLVWSEDSAIPSFITSAVAVFADNGVQETQVFEMVANIYAIQDSETSYAAQELVNDGYTSVYKIDTSLFTISPLAINATNDSDNNDKIEFAFTETGATLNSGDLVYIFLSETPVTQQQVEEWFDEQWGD